MEREAELRRVDLASDPLEQFRSWFAEAGAALEVPEAMALATAAPEGAPSVRMVLLKGFDERGLVFYSHHTSRKGRELEANPQAALLFHWSPLGRQVRVEGRVEHVSGEESDAYFATRPRGAQLGALVSRQSEPLESRDPSWTSGSASSSARWATVPCRGRRRGAASGSRRRPGSSGSTAPAACTTASATCRNRRAAGGSSGSSRDAHGSAAATPT